MSVRRLRAVGGLATDPSAHTDPEALSTASNVLLHRPGLIQPRFGLGDTTGIAARSVSRRPIAVTAYDGDLVVQSLDGSTYSLERGSTTTVYSSDVTPYNVTKSGVTSFARMRGSLYFTTDDGVKRLADIAATSVSLAGVQQWYAWIPWTAAVTINVGTTAEIDRYAIKADSAVAYRYCWRRIEDTNGYTRRSAPSSRWVVSLASASLLVFGRIYLPTGTAAGDTLELYRTENVSPSTATPGREYYLAKEYVITSADVTAGYIASGTLIDDVADSLLGATLYTSPSQGGIQQANEPPPSAAFIASWGGVMWYGNTLARSSVFAEIVALNNIDFTDDAYGAAGRTGLHFSAGTCTYASGSAAVTVIDPTDATHPFGMKVGQYITDAANGPLAAGTHVPASTTIATITTTVTLNNATLAAADTINVFGQTFTWRAAASLSTEITIGGTSAASATNLAAKLDGWAWDEPFNVTASANVADVTMTEASGLAACAVVTGTGQTVAYALTMSANALASGVAQAYSARDYVSINNGTGGIRFFTTSRTDSVSTSTTGAQYRLFNLDNSSDTPVSDFNARLGFTADYLANAINRYSTEVDTAFGIRAYRDSENTRGDSVGDGGFALVADQSVVSLGDITIDCPVRTAAFRPDPTDSITSEGTSALGRVYFSKPDEPEAVPLLNFFDVGDRERDVLAFAPLDRAMLVFKEDGVYAISGVAPNDWRVDVVDSSLRLLAPQATCVLGGICYAWTNRGVMAVTEAGARFISGPISDALREYQRLLPQDDANTKRAYWMVAHERAGLVILGAGDAANDTITAAWWVYSTTTGRWAKWPIESRCAAYDPAEDRMVHSPNIGAWSLLYERNDEDASTSYVDASLTPLTGAVSGTTVTIAQSAFGGFTPAIGDVIKDATLYRRVTAVAEDGADYDLTVATGLTGTSFTWYQGFATTLAWQAQQLPGIGARWSEGHVVLQKDDSAYVSTWPLEVGGSVEDRGGSVVATITPDANDLVRRVRVGLPREIVRANDLYPFLIMKTAGVFWQVAALDLHFMPQSRRVGR